MSDFADLASTILGYCSVDIIAIPALLIARLPLVKDPAQVRIVWLRRATELVDRRNSRWTRMQLSPDMMLPWLTVGALGLWVLLMVVVGIPWAIFGNPRENHIVRIFIIIDAVLSAPYAAFCMFAICAVSYYALRAQRSS